MDDFIGSWTCITPLTNVSDPLGDFIYFRLIYEYPDRQISANTQLILDRMMIWANVIALTLVTLWLFYIGHRVLTRQLRGPMTHLATNMVKVTLIVTAATTMSVFGTDLRQLLTVDLDKTINQQFTGGGGQTTADNIDRSLAYTQLALSLIDTVQVPESAAKAQANWHQDPSTAG